MKNKFVLICLSIVLALGGLGVGYAAWTDTVTINGSVSTAEMCLEWSTLQDVDPCPNGFITGDYYLGSEDYNLNLAAITGDPDGWPLDGCQDVEYVLTDKNVACVDIDGVDTDMVLVTIYNAYPLYGWDMEIEIHNCGTLPFKITGIQIIPVNFTLANYPWNGPACQTPPNNGGPIWVKVVDGIGSQLEPSDEAGSSFKIVVQQSALQNAGRGEPGDPPAYQFYVKYFVKQFNEYP